MTSQSCMNVACVMYHILIYFSCKDRMVSYLKCWICCEAVLFVIWLVGVIGC